MSETHTLKWVWYEPSRSVDRYSLLLSINAISGIFCFIVSMLLGVYNLISKIRGLMRKQNTGEAILQIPSSLCTTSQDEITNTEQR